MSPPSPNPPRWLDREALATYISVRVDEIPRILRAGKLPQLSYHLGPKSPRWWSASINEVFGLAPAPAPPRGAARLAEIILKKGKPGRGPGQPQTAQEATNTFVAKILAKPARKRRCSPLDARPVSDQSATERRPVPDL